MRPLKLINYLVRRHSLPLLGLALAAAALRQRRLARGDAAIVERRRRAVSAAPPAGPAPKVSALVAAWDEAAHIEEHLRSFQALRYPQIELILCAGGADGTLELVRQAAGGRVTVLEQQPGEGKQRALARCFEQAGGELIYLTDADCRYDEAALRHLVGAVAGGEAAATGDSRPLPAQRGRLIPHYVWAADAYAASHGLAYVNGLLGRNALISRAALLASGGMDFAAPTGTDYHLGQRLLRAGFRIRHVPESCVATRYPETLGGYWRKQARWLRNLLLYGGAYAAGHHVRDVLRSALVGAVMLGLPLAGRPARPAAWLLWAALLAYGVGARWRYAVFLRQVYGEPAPAAYGAALPGLVLADCAIWVTPLVQALSKRQRHRW